MVNLWCAVHAAQYTSVQPIFASFWQLVECKDSDIAGRVRLRSSA
jgi:hypothetical protein